MLIIVKYYIISLNLYNYLYKILLNLLYYSGDKLFDVLKSKLRLKILDDTNDRYKRLGYDIENQDIKLRITDTYNNESRDRIGLIRKKVRTQITSIGSKIATMFKEFKEGDNKHNAFLSFIKYDKFILDSEAVGTILSAYEHSNLFKMIQQTDITKMTNLYLACSEGSSTNRLSEKSQATEEQVKLFIENDIDEFKKILRKQSPKVDYGESALIKKYSTKGSAVINKSNNNKRKHENNIYSKNNSDDDNKSESSISIAKSKKQKILKSNFLGKNCNYFIVFYKILIIAVLILYNIN